MKKLLNILLCLILTFNFGYAQVPQGVGYQGVATDANGIELVNQAISIRASVLSGSANGTIEWEETHATTTDTFGLFTLTIGQGTSTTNGLQTSFADISWGTNTHFLKIEMDATGGMDYSLMGVNQMMSVPYALYAENSGNPGNPGLQGEVGEQGPAGMDGEDAILNYDTLAQYLSIDSTFVNTVTSNIGGGGGCDFSFPEGIGESIAWDLSGTGVNNSNDYVVPAGKNLFITNVYTNDGSSFRIDGIRVIDEDWGAGGSSSTVQGMLKLPLCAKSGQVISNTSGGTNTFYGVLTDATVEPISFWFDDPGTGFDTYTVPAGKKLYITNIWAYGGGNYNSELTIDGVPIGKEPFNKPGTGSSKSLEMPLFINSGSVVSIPDNYASFNGYLADEDYFADCGGGGSSEGGQGEGQNIGDMLYWGGDSWENLSIGSPGSTLQVGVDGSLTWNNYLAIGDDWAGGKIAYLFQPGDPGYIDGETHGFVVHPLHHSDFPQNQTPLGWGCDDIITGINNSTFGEGYNNTLLIASQCPTGNAGVFSNVITCAKFWSDLIYGGYDDWFMPNSSEALVLDSSVLPVDYFVLSEESTTNPLSQCITADFYIGGASLSWTGKSAGNLSIGIRQF